MDLSGVVFRHLPCFSGAGIDSLPSKSCIHVRSSFDASSRCSVIFRRNPSYRGCRIGSNYGFSDNGHSQYYPSPVCGTKKGKEKDQKAVSTKKKLKMLKGLSKNLSFFSELGFAPETGLVQGKMISEAAEGLIEQLQKEITVEKELKMKKKEEKAKLKRLRMKSMLGSDSSSTDAVTTLTALPASVSQEDSLQKDNVECIPQASTSCCATVIIEQIIEESSTVTRPSAKKVEVCMGGKCKKSGAGALMEEFERVIGNEVALIGCKCMGKCKDGPNVRVLNSSNEI